MRFLFFVLGVPMMIMSFFQVPDALPFVKTQQLFVNGNEIVLSEDSQNLLQTQIQQLFEDSHTLPALSVVFGDDFQQMFDEKTFVCLKFDQTFQINDLPFDELYFEVTPESYGFNVFRGNDGVVQGRCIFVDLNGKTTKEFYGFVTSLEEMENNFSKTEKPEILPPIENPSI